MGQVLHGVNGPLSDPRGNELADYEEVDLPNWGAHHPIAWGAAAIGFVLAGFLVAALMVTLLG